MPSQRITSHGTASLKETMDLEPSEGDRLRYDLPKGQRKGDTENAGQDLLPDVRRQATQELADHLEGVQRATQEDGTIRGTVEWIGSPERNAKVVVLVNVPSEADPVRFFMDKPKVWDRNRYPFVRFVEGYGYGPGNIAAMHEDGVAVNVVETQDDDYELVVPDNRGWLARQTGRTSSLREMARGEDNEMWVLAWWGGSFLIAQVVLAGLVFPTEYGLTVNLLAWLGFSAVAYLGAWVSTGLGMMVVGYHLLGWGDD